ncbi:hypothetical protein PMZ80_000217 [Knufia obscura]|uniref:Uncharacterized protein n=2 Tax=Knufia TaxID=430999 RepID=A0AAN8EJG3_9EURO|nr:hypothetical protein PMZ80_000217 [Knufia obscura]KAK5956853.1 hypothetical protein OHC33_002342 [Knufia fluminis]
MVTDVDPLVRFRRYLPKRKRTRDEYRSTQWPPCRNCFYNSKICYKSHDMAKSCDGCIATKMLCKHDLTGAIPRQYKFKQQNRHGQHAKDLPNHQQGNFEDNSFSAFHESMLDAANGVTDDDGEEAGAHTDPLVLYAKYLPKKQGPAHMHMTPERRPCRYCFSNSQFCYKSCGPAGKCDACQSRGIKCNPDLTGAVPTNKKKKIAHDAQLQAQNHFADHVSIATNSDAGGPQPAHEGGRIWSSTSGEDAEETDDLDYAAAYGDDIPSDVSSEVERRLNDDDILALFDGNKNDSGYQTLQLYLQHPPRSALPGPAPCRFPCRRCLQQKPCCVRDNGSKYSCRSCVKGLKGACNRDLRGVKPYAKRYSTFPGIELGSISGITPDQSGGRRRTNLI